MSVSGLDFFIFYRTVLGIVAVTFMAAGLVRTVRSVCAFRRLPPRFQELIRRVILEKRFLVDVVQIVVLFLLLAALICAQFLIG